MMHEQATSKASHIILAGVLVALAGMLLVCAPAKAHATSAFVTDKESALEFIEDNVESGNTITEAQAKEIKAYASTYGISQKDCSAKVWDIINKAIAAVTEIPDQRAKVKASTTNIAALTRGIRSFTATTKAVPAKGVKGLKYQYAWKKAGAKKWTYSISSSKKFTASKLTGNAEYLVKVRPYEKCYGEKLYGNWAGYKKITTLRNYTPGSYKVTISALNVRAKASLKSKILTKLARNAGTAVKSVLVSGGNAWGRINSEDGKAYIMLRYTQQMQPGKYVITSMTNVRTKPSLKAGVRSTLSKGAVVKVTKTQVKNGVVWGTVKVKKKTSYIDLAYAQKR